MLGSKGYQTLVFNEDDHVYKLEDMVFTSVTSFISAFIPEETAQEIITLKRKDWSKLQTCRYNNLTDEEIIAEWESVRDESADMGKKMHKMIEDDIGMELKGVPANKRPFDAGFSTEMRAYRKFRAKNPTWKPAATETTVFDKDLGVCGTFDAIFYDESEKHYVLLDWKRCKNLSSGYGETKPLHPLLEGLTCSNCTKYFLQLCVYKWCIDKRCNDVAYEVNLVSDGGSRGASYVPEIPKYAGNIGRCYILNMHPNLGGHYQLLKLEGQFLEQYGLPFLTDQANVVARPGKRRKTKCTKL